MGTKTYDWGRKQIKVSIVFASPPNLLAGKNALDQGTISLGANKAKAIKKDSIEFIEASEILPKLQELLDRNHINLVSVARSNPVVTKLAENSR